MRSFTPDGQLGEVKDRAVFAGGGGQQSAAFSLLGAAVTVVDLSEAQLQRDREAAAHYGANIQTLQGDMRDLSRFPAQAFDIVWQPYSLNFVPEVQLVFQEVRGFCGQGAFIILTPPIRLSAA